MSFQKLYFFHSKECIDNFDLYRLCIVYHEAKFCSKKNRCFIFWKKKEAKEEMYIELIQLKSEGSFLPTRCEEIELWAYVGRLLCDCNSDNYEISDLVLDFCKPRFPHAKNGKKNKNFLLGWWQYSMRSCTLDPIFISMNFALTILPHPLLCFFPALSIFCSQDFIPYHHSNDLL